ncbi:MAG: ribosome silencing factor [Planctomycetota bacterium]|nr:ribosome silencing factor [Planctomycetota bacterium]
MNNATTPNDPPTPTPTPTPTTEQFLTKATATTPPLERGGPAEALAIELARLFHDDKCTDVVVLDVRGMSPLTDYLVVGSGSSERQMASVLDHAVEIVEKRGGEAFGITKDAGTLWLIADFVDVVAHLFEPNTRAVYDIEMLWGDARRVEWERTPKA